MKKKVYEKPTIMALAILPMQMIASSGGNGGGPRMVSQINEIEGEDIDEWEEED